MKKLSGPALFGGLLGVVHFFWMMIYLFVLESPGPFFTIIIDYPVVILVSLFREYIHPLLEIFLIITGGSLMYALIGYGIGRLVKGVISEVRSERMP